MNSEDIYTAVEERYGAVSSGAAPQARDAYSKSVARAFGYTEEELTSIPTESNLGLSCGNPLALASLREGETVIDFGSGAGFDAFLAARAVGPIGQVIGVDMNQDMLALAEKNKAKSGANNVKFVHARITRIPIDDQIADVIISNCVINLVPEDEKQLVFQEMFRLLKPGGRVAVADTLAKKRLSETLKKSVAAYVGCISGASLVSQYQEYFKQAGFTDVLISNTNVDLNVYLDTLPDGSRRNKDATEECCGPKSSDTECCVTAAVGGIDHGALATELAGVDLNEWVGSYKLFAFKA